MTDLWIALAAVTFLLAGYWLMKRLDYFLAFHIAVPEDAAKPGADLALYAPEELKRALCPKLTQAGIAFDLIEDEESLAGQNYPLICALGDDDLQNLLLCSLGKKLGQGHSIVARCNNPLYRSLFQDTGAVCLETSEPPEERILCEVKRIRENADLRGTPAC